MSKNKTALLVLECPWYDPVDNPKRASVLPFLQGLERVFDDFNIYYSTFYEKNGFEAALKNDLTQTKEDRLFLYVGSHGSGGQIANMNVSTMLKIIKDVAKKKNIEGLILSSCQIGKNQKKIIEAMKGSSLLWVLSYRENVDWLQSILFETCVLEKMMLPFSGRKDKINNGLNPIMFRFLDALSVFNLDNNQFASSAKSDKQISFKDAFFINLQYKGRGQRPNEIHADLTGILKIVEQQ